MYFRDQKASFFPCESSKYYHIVVLGLILPTLRILTAIALWSIEIVMQIRVYILFNCSKRVRLKAFLLKT